MVGKSKIDQLCLKHEGMEQAIIDLRRSNMGYHDIARLLITTFHLQGEDIPSHMAVKRWLKRRKIQDYQQRLEDGEDLDETLRSEFRDRLFEIDDETHELFVIMKKSLKRIMKMSTDDMKIIRACKDTIVTMEQSRKNWATLMTLGINEFKDKKEAEHKTTINIDKFLLEISNDMSPDGRRELVSLLLLRKDKYAKLENKQAKHYVDT